MDESHDEIEYSLEDLLIFPTRKGLRRSIELIEASFVLEVEIMKQLGVPKQTNESMMNEQREIVDIAKNELDNHATQVTSNACASG